MDQDKQTLLDAAKAVVNARVPAGDYSEWANLRAAIAREEAMVSTPHPTRWWQVECQKATDRAQQAEADAAWHKAESARLSVDLALLRAAGSIERAKALESAQWRERAEKAEAEVAELIDMKVNPVVFAPEPFEGNPQTCAFGSNAFRGNREVAEPDDNDEDPVDPVTGWTFATYRRVVETLGGKS